MIEATLILLISLLSVAWFVDRADRRAHLAELCRQADDTRERLLRQNGQLQKLLASKDLAVYSAIEGADKAATSRSRTDEDEARMAAARGSNGFEAF